MALVTAAKCEHDHRHEETVEIVWTGPEPGETRFRQTEQAILEVVNSATRRLTVVSYAVYRIPRIREAWSPPPPGRRYPADRGNTEPDRGPGRIRLPPGPGQQRGLGLLRLLLAQENRPRTIMARSASCTSNAPLPMDIGCFCRCQLHRVCLHHQHGVGILFVRAGSYRHR